MFSGTSTAESDKLNIKDEKNNIRTTLSDALKALSMLNRTVECAA